MCGIAGFVQPQPGVALEDIEAQLACLVHRGPDAAGQVAGRRGVVGQTRLAIIDLVSGDPPIANEDGRIGVALNGEIYNFRELRAELERDGHTFATSGDTEVIAHLAEDRSPVELARKLDGMFAFAVWDDRRERLVVGRDRMGKKPIYYWADQGRLVFGSEIKAVLAHPAVPRRLEPSAIPAYLTFGYVPTPRTFFEGISSIPPAHVLVCEPGGEPRLEQYWELPVPGVDGVSSADVSLDEAAEHVRALLGAAVERRLVADVPLGAFLSGGIDSSAVVGLMAGLMERPVKTFTIGFDDRDGFDERSYADLVARRFGTEHTPFEVSPDAVDLVERLVWHYDQPFGDSSAVPTFVLSELTRGHVTVALAGDGGDELFAGYERFAAGVAADHYRRMPRLARRAAPELLGALPSRAAGGRVGSLQRFAGQAERGLPDAFRSWISFVEEPRRGELVLEDDDWGLADYQTIWDASSGARPLDRLLDLNMRTYLLDDLLPKVDRMSMAHALEVRAPFLDTALVEFALSLPPSAKARGLSLKRVLKKAMEGLLPSEIIDRRKWGFGVPLDRWFRTDLQAFVDSTLGSKDARVRGHLAPDQIDGLLAEHRSGARDHGHALWTLLTLELFLRREGW
jgi:asparagine synthase (glutamine-hydrolysing)